MSDTTFYKLNRNMTRDNLLNMYKRLDTARSIKYKENHDRLISRNNVFRLVENGDLDYLVDLYNSKIPGIKKLIQSLPYEGKELSPKMLELYCIHLFHFKYNRKVVRVIHQSTASDGKPIHDFDVDDNGNIIKHEVKLMDYNNRTSLNESKGKSRFFYERFWGNIQTANKQDAEVLIIKIKNYADNEMEKTLKEYLKQELEGMIEQNDKIVFSSKHLHEWSIKKIVILTEDTDFFEIEVKAI